jgi:MFS family permease
MKRIVSSEFITVTAVMGLGVLASSILQPILPLYLISIDISPELLGLMFSVAMVGMVIGESGWGWVADKIGLKLPLSMGTTVCGLVVLCFLFTKNISIIFLIFFLWGTVRSALFGPGRGYVGANAPPLKKATFMAIIAVMISASRSLGALPSGFMVDTWGYHSVFYGACGVSLLGGFTVLIGLRRIQSVEIKPGTSPRSSPDETVASLYRPLATQCIVAAFQFFGFGIFMTFLPLLATQVVGVSATKVGILFTIGGLVTVVLGIPMGMLADRIGKKRSMIIGLLLSATALAGTAYGKSFSWLIVFVIIRSMGFSIFSPAALGLLSESIPLQKQSTVMGIYGGVCENTGIVAGSALGGFIWSALSPQATFLMGAISASLGGVICLTLLDSKPSQRDGLTTDAETDCCQ